MRAGSIRVAGGDHVPGRGGDEAIADDPKRCGPAILGASGTELHVERRGRRSVVLRQIPAGIALLDQSDQARVLKDPEVPRQVRGCTPSYLATPDAVSCRSARIARIANRVGWT